MDHNDPSKPLYAVCINGESYGPTDTVSTRSALGLTTSFKEIDYISLLDIPSNLSEIRIKYSGGGYRMYIKSISFTPLAPVQN